MEREPLIVFIILLSFCFLTLILYYFNYVSLYSYVLVIMILIILILITLINIYQGKGLTCRDQESNKDNPRDSYKTLGEGVLKYLK